MPKRILCALLALLLVLSLAACGGEDQPEKENQTDTKAETQTKDEPEQTAQEDAAGQDAAQDTAQAAGSTAVQDTAAQDAAAPSGGQSSAAQPSGGSSSAKPSTGGSSSSQPSGGSGSSGSSGGSSSGGSSTPEPAPDPTPAGTLTQLMDRLYAGVSAEMPMVGNTVIDSSNSSYYLGISFDRVEEGLASEAMIGSIAHSICLVRVKDGVDAQQVATDIRQNVNSYKWVCVGVEPEQVRTLVRGRLVALIMTNSAPDQFAASFQAL